MPKSIFLVVLLGFTFLSYSQDYTNGGTFTGNIESTFQYLNNDTIIDATQPAQKGLINSYMNVFYTNKNFKAGMRLESYLPRIQGYPNRFDGTGIGMRYIGYTNNLVDVTLGSFYEQFGAGLSLRAYEDRALGYDNLLDGARLIVKPYSGVTLKGVYGYQRLSFQQGRIVHGEGIVRGVDAEINFKEAFDSLLSDDWDFGLGLSFVSKFQADNDNDLILPQNVGAYGGRFKARYKNINLDGEYILKEQDPSNDNNKIYNYGHAAIFNLGYSKKGFGVLLSGKSVDNMSYRSDRTKDLQDVFINYLPSLNKTHTYNLVATLYPYATQPLGEVAYQAEVLYSFKKGTLIGGKYGTTVNLNFSTTYRPVQHTSGINTLDSTGVTYRARPFDMSDSLYWRDINVNVTKKINKKLSFIFSYFNITINNDVAKISNDAKGIISSHIGVIETSYKINKKHAIRSEIQGLFVNPIQKGPDAGKINDKGDWATILVEYTISPHWSFGFMDQYNYGNPVEAKRVHYPIFTFGYVKDATRFSIYYGRQRAGLFCVGGVCRFVPASNGLTFSFTQSF
jgi:hypothetical protein